MGVTFDTSKLQKKLDKLSDIELEPILTKACLIVERTAKEKCPVNTGILRASIQSSVSERQGTVGTNVEYAPYVEYGTGLFASEGNGRQDRWSYQDAKGEWHSTLGQQPQPFLHPALADNREAIVEAFNEGVSKAMR